MQGEHNYQKEAIRHNATEHIHHVTIDYDMSLKFRQAQSDFLDKKDIIYLYFYMVDDS